MATKVLPKYQNMGYAQSSKLFNDCGKCMEQLYCKWYGSTYSLSSGKVAYLRDLVMTGQITLAKFRKVFNEASYFWIRDVEKAKEFLKDYKFLTPLIHAYILQQLKQNQ